MPPTVRDELRRFVDDGDIDLSGGNYRPSAAALFGTYRTKGPPNRFTCHLNATIRRSTATP